VPAGRLDSPLQQVYPQLSGHDEGSDRQACAQDNRFDDQHALNSLLHNTSIAAILNRGESAEENRSKVFLGGHFSRCSLRSRPNSMGGRLEKHSDKIVDSKDYYNVTFAYSPGYGGVPEWRDVKPGVFHSNGRGKEHIKWRLLRWHSDWWGGPGRWLPVDRGVEGMQKEIELWRAEGAIRGTSDPSHGPSTWPPGLNLGDAEASTSAAGSSCTLGSCSPACRAGEQGICEQVGCFLLAHTHSSDSFPPLGGIQ